jgi:hypothetical protein
MPPHDEQPSTADDVLEAGNALGNFLRDRRARLDPASFGFQIGRRRTPACAARRSPSAPTSAPPGTPGWSRAAAERPRPMCSTASRRA